VFTAWTHEGASTMPYAVRKMQRSIMVYKIEEEIVALLE
jgi:hypothetical protein